MTKEQFFSCITPILDDVREMLNKKHKEYDANDNRFWNFIRAAEMRRCTPEKILFDFLTKHIISIQDFADGAVQLSPPQLKEKTIDIIIYSLILYAMSVEDASDLF